MVENTPTITTTTTNNNDNNNINNKAFWRRQTRSLSAL
jgi:hypothetical protein